MAEFYRKRTPGGSHVLSVRLSQEVLDGLNEIKAVFQRRYPTEKFPSLAACLDLALTKYLIEVGDNPKALRAEVDEFKARYEKAEPV